MIDSKLLTGCLTGENSEQFQYFLDDDSDSSVEDNPKNGSESGSKRKVSQTNQNHSQNISKKHKTENIDSKNSNSNTIQNAKKKFRSPVSNKLM